LNNKNGFRFIESVCAKIVYVAGTDKPLGKALLEPSRVSVSSGIITVLIVIEWFCLATGN
jgi:hypothetical protein